MRRATGMVPVVSGLPSYQSCPSSILGLGVLCGLSLLLVLVLAQRVFFSWSSVFFLSLEKPTFLNDNMPWNPRTTGLSVA